MNIFKSRKTAAIIMVIVIIASSFLGMAKTVVSEKNKVDDAFLLGCNGDGNSISSDLAEIITYVYNFKGVAVKYLGTDSTLISEIENKAQTLSAAQTPSEKSTALTTLYMSVSEAWRLLQDSDMISETDKKSCKIAFYDIDDRRDKISHDGYNTLANEYNKMLKQFPVILVSALSFVKEAELFS